MAKRAILYARVSTQEQAERGYSIQTQLDDLRRYAQSEGYDVCAEEIDPGYGRETLERPGIENVRARVAMGDVDVVLAWRRDRFGASPCPEVLSIEFDAYGTKLRGLDDAGDGDDAYLINGFKDLMSKNELRTLVARSRMGKIGKARGGKIVATQNPDYGFRFDDSRDYYEVDEDKMQVVRRIFALVADGTTLYGVVNALNTEGVESPSSKSWNTTFVRNLLKDDVYKPHDRNELQALVSQGLLRSDVLAGLSGESHGIKWANRYQYKTVRRFVDDGHGGKKTRRNHKIIERPREHWVAVPVPDAGIPSEIVEKARSGIATNKAASNAGRRFWKLSGGIAICGECGRRMTAQTATPGKSHSTTLYYYGCRHKYRKGDCNNRKNVRAERLEACVADFVTDLLSDESRLIEQMDALIQQERSSLADPEPRMRACAETLAGINRKIEGYWDLAASGDISKEQMRARVSELQEQKAVTEDALAAASNRQERINELERDKAVLLDQYRNLALSRGLSGFTPEQRHDIYRRLNLVVRVHPDQGLSIDGDLPLAFSYLNSNLIAVFGEASDLEYDESGFSCTMSMQIKSGR